MFVITEIMRDDNLIYVFLFIVWNWVWLFSRKYLISRNINRQNLIHFPNDFLKLHLSEKDTILAKIKIKIKFFKKLQICFSRCCSCFATDSEIYKRYLWFWVNCNTNNLSCVKLNSQNENSATFPYALSYLKWSKLLNY